MSSAFTWRRSAFNTCGIQRPRDLLSLPHSARAIERSRYIFVRSLSSVRWLFPDAGIRTSIQSKLQPRKSSKSKLQRLSSSSSGNATTKTSDCAGTTQSSCDRPCPQLHFMPQREKSFWRRRLFGLQEVSQPRHMALLRAEETFAALSKSPL
jgi:hypothetical protein